MTIASNLLKDFHENEPDGTYVLIKFLPLESEEINKIYSVFKIPNLISSDEIHVTLMYSPSTPYREVKPELIGQRIIVTNPRYRMFDKDLSTLVIEFDNKILSERHKILTSTYGLRHTYEDFKPHITLSENIGNFDSSSLPPFPLKALTIAEELSQPANS